MSTPPSGPSSRGSSCPTPRLAYLGRAHLARLRGRPERPPRIFEQYRRQLADDADEIAGTVASPPREIELAFRELMAPT